MSQDKAPEKKPAVAPAAAPPKKLNEEEERAQALNSTLTSHQKASMGSGFTDTTAERRRNSLLAMAVPKIATDAVPALPTQKFDGKTVPDALKGRDVWKAVQAPVVSREGKRSRALYEQVVKQFGITVNPRYDDDAPGKPRGHIFVWDVSRAMGCEIPHFVGAKELTLAQTCDWVRHEGPMRGWRRVSDLWETLETGKMVVAIPKQPTVKQIAVVAPQDRSPDGKPRLSGACLIRSEAGGFREMFGVMALEYFWHD